MLVPGFHRNHHAAISSLELAFERRVFPKEMAHHAFAARQIDQIALKPNQARASE